MLLSFRLATAMLIAASVPRTSAEKILSDAGAQEPRLIVRGKGFLVHAVPNPTPNREPLERTPGGMQLLHTSLPSGEMKVLATTGSWVSYRTHVPRYSQARFAGLAADAERLYVLTCERSGRNTPPPEVPAGAAKAGEVAGSGRYRLSVYCLADGSRVYEQPLDPASMPARAPAETVGTGLLRLTRGGVSCNGMDWSFEGKRLVKAVLPGVVKAIKRDGIVLETGTEVLVTARTRFFLETGRDPKEAGLEDLRAGKAVQVVAEDEGGKLTAVQVMVSLVQPAAQRPPAPPGK